MLFDTALYDKYLTGIISNIANIYFALTTQAISCQNT
jgi:hypothetical protein